MTFEITHKKVNSKPDVADSSIVKPSDWNDKHKLSVSPGVVGRYYNTGNGEPDVLPLYFDSVAFTARFDLTGSVLVPSGTTAQRPAPQSGMIRFNSETEHLEVYQNGLWVDLVVAIDAKVPTGTYIYTFAPGALPGWVVAFGSIGNAASLASNRANADTEALFKLLWNNFPDSFCPVSGGRTPGVDGANVDWANNKTLGLPDLRETVVAGAGSMGKADLISGWEISNNRLKNLMAAPILGGFGEIVDAGTFAGEKGHVLTKPELAKHSHTMTDAVTMEAPTSATVVGTPWLGPEEIETSEVGEDKPHNTVQPTILLNALIKL